MLENVPKVDARETAMTKMVALGTDSEKKPEPENTAVPPKREKASAVFIQMAGQELVARVRKEARSADAMPFLTASDGLIYRWDEGARSFAPFSDGELERLIHQYLDVAERSGGSMTNRTIGFVRSIAAFVRAHVVSDRGITTDIISLSDGFFDLRDMTAMPTPQRLTDYPLVVRSLPYSSAELSGDCDKPTTPLLSAYLGSITKEMPKDEADGFVAMLQEMCGLAWGDPNALASFFVNVGEGRNGKSVLTKILTSAVGRSVTSSLDLEALTAGSDTKRKALIGKALNVGEESESRIKMGNLNSLKSLVSGEVQVITPNYATEPVEWKPNTLFIFNVNSLPTSAIDNALAERMVVIRWSRMIPLQERIPNLEQAVINSRSEMLEFIRWAWTGLRRIRATGRLTRIRQSIEATRELIADSDPFHGFFDPQICMSYTPDPSVLEYTPVIIRERYEHFCRNNGYGIVPGRSFFLKLRNVIGIDSKVNKGKRVYPGVFTFLE